MRRVTSGSVLVLTCDPAELHHFWLDRYTPEVIAVEANRYPPIATIATLLGPATEVIPVPSGSTARTASRDALNRMPELGRPEYVRLS